MARERFSPRRSQYGAPMRHAVPSIYDAAPGEQLQAAKPVAKRRRLVKPLGIFAALAAIAAGGVMYMAVSNAATLNADCTLIVPANPLSAQGLATPYQLVATDPAAGPCNEANADQSAYVQGAIIGPDGALTLYNPLVVDQGTQPAAAPAAATVPAGATIGVWFGFNGDNLTLRSANGTNSLRQGRCVNGLGNSIFGQFAYCNAPAFFRAANAAIRAGTLKVPPLGTAADGKPCPTVRDFSVVDMDQSDNVTTHYLANANGQMAQPNAAGRAAIGANPADLANGSDNRLLDAFMDPALGCTPWAMPEQSADGAMTNSLPLNELQAAAFQPAPVAIVPLTNPMTLVNDRQSRQKTNLYRVGVDQPVIGAADNGSGTNYCTNMYTNAAGVPRVFTAQASFAAAPSPDPAATNLFTFLAMRANDAFATLNCQNLINMASPITLTTDGNGVVTAATLAGTGGAGGGGPAPSASAAAPGSPAASAVPSASAAVPGSPAASAVPSGPAAPSASAAVPGSPAASTMPSVMPTAPGPSAPASAAVPSVSPMPSPTATCGRYRWWTHRQHRHWWPWG
jgi:hypothetical protein